MMNSRVFRGTAAALGAAVLLGAAYLAGRAGAGEEPAPPRKHDHAAACVHPPADPAPVVAPGEKEKAAVQLRDLQADLRKVASNRTAQLNDLQNFLSNNLAEGKISALQVLDMFRTETDAATLDLLQGVLAANPEAADQPGVLDAFLTFAASDPDPARRLTALAFLGSAWDKDGRVREALFAAARPGGDLETRLTALGTFQAYAAKNRGQAESVNSGLLDLAKADPNADIRAQALGAVEIRSAGEAIVLRVSEFLLDPGPAARLAAAERLGDAPPETQRAVVQAVDAALARETEEGVKHLLLVTLVKAGRAGAADLIRRAGDRDPSLRQDASEYLAALQKGYSDWADLERVKADLEGARAR